MIEIELKNVAAYGKDKIDATTLNKYNYISTDNLIPDKGGISTSDYLPVKGKVSKFDIGDTLVSNIRPYFKKIWYANEIGGCSNDVIVFKPNKNKIDPKFLYYQLSKDEFFDFMMSGANGTKMPRGNKNAIPTFRLNLPPLPTQKRIASILSAYDDLIENNLKRIKLLEEIAQRTYEEWFVKFRVNGEHLPIDETTGLPVGWKCESFNNIVEIISGFPFKSGDYVEDGKFKIVTIKNVQDGYFVPETTDILLEIPNKVKAEQVLHTCDIIVSLTGNVGRICLVYGDNYLLNQRVAKVIPLDEYSKAYVYFLLRSKAMITSLENLSNGAAQQNLSPINMGNMKVNIPDKNLLMKFGELANSIIDLISKLNLENQKLMQSRDILLPRLMSGTINVES